MMVLQAGCCSPSRFCAGHTGDTYALPTERSRPAAGTCPHCSNSADHSPALGDPRTPSHTHSQNSAYLLPFETHTAAQAACYCTCPCANIAPLYNRSPRTPHPALLQRWVLWVPLMHLQAPLVRPLPQAPGPRPLAAAMPAAASQTGC